MISPRFLFAVLVCIPYLFIDDVVSMDLLCKERGDLASIGDVYCQIQEERQGLNLVQQFADDIEEPSIPNESSLPVQSSPVIGNSRQSCIVGETDQSFSRIPVRIQQFTSRRKPHEDFCFAARLYDTFYSIVRENVFSTSADVFFLPRWYRATDDPVFTKRLDRMIDGIVDWNRCEPLVAAWGNFFVPCLSGVLTADFRGPLCGRKHEYFSSQQSPPLTFDRLLSFNHLSFMGGRHGQTEILSGICH